ncbi:MAG: TlpA disulfide reductase family protein [Kiritimatiellia bacterium]|nr:TlpA disulfide reductase family protein [Kiritimatiellia bacterium]
MILGLVFLLPGANVLHAWEKAPFFRLPDLDSGEQVSLDDFRGQIVVLDFFNASCGDCARISWELESEVQEYYAARSGNPHGIAVQVVAVNSEAAEQEDMDAFLQETELGMVLDDPEGTLLQRYGGAGLPYVVVIDATGTGSGTATPRVVLRQAKYGGLKKLRDIIDTITGQTAPAASSPGTQANTTPGSDLSLPVLETQREVTHETTLDVAAMIASDVYVADTLAVYRHKRPSTEFSLAASYRPTRMDFKSEPSGIRLDKRLEEDHFGVQGGVRSDLNENLELKVGGGAYDGFQTYRALWMDEYNRLKFGDLPGYRDAHPWGYNASPSLRWEYLPDVGFAEAGIAYQYDCVSPGYEGGPPLVRLRDDYETVGGFLSFENVLTRRLRTMVEGRIDDTTDRETRVTLQGALHYALAENWAVRLAVGYVKENPDFSARTASAALERDWHGIWFVSVFGRYYEDTGEIDNGIANEAAAPPIQTYQAGLGVRRKGTRSTIKFDIGPCFSRYELHPKRNTDFDQLYKDRDWLSLQAAFQYQF